jgi:hypothetical protein
MEGSQRPGSAKNLPIEAAEAAAAEAAAAPEAAGEVAAGAAAVAGAAAAAVAVCRGAATATARPPVYFDRRQDRVTSSTRRSPVRTKGWPRLSLFSAPRLISTPQLAILREPEVSSDAPLAEGT